MISDWLRFTPSKR